MEVVFTAKTTGLYEFTWTDFSPSSVSNTEMLITDLAEVDSAGKTLTIASNCVTGPSSSSTQHVTVGLQKDDRVAIFQVSGLAAAKSRFSGKKVWCGCD